MTPERKILESILRLLRKRSLEGAPVWWLKVHGNPIQRAGVPDLLICWYGRFVGIEVKRPGRDPTRLQEHVMSWIRRAGGATAVCHSAEEVDAVLLERR